MKQEKKNGARAAIATIIWLVVFGIGAYVGFIRYYCANPVPYDPVTSHPYTCDTPYTNFGTAIALAVVFGVPTLLGILYWKFGFPRPNTQKESGKNHTEAKM